MSLLAVWPTPEFLNTAFHGSSPKESPPCLSWYYKPRSKLVHLGDLIDNEKLQRNFEHILQFIQLGFPVKVFKQDWFPGLICVPLFHCYQCLDVWAATDRVPTTCSDEAQQVHGPMMAVSMTKYNQLFALLRKDWNRKNTVTSAKLVAHVADQSTGSAGSPERRSAEELGTKQLRNEREKGLGNNILNREPEKPVVKVSEFVDIDELVRKYRRKSSPKTTVSQESLAEVETRGQTVKFSADLPEELEASKNEECNLCGGRKNIDGKGKVQEKIGEETKSEERENDKKEKEMVEEEKAAGKLKTRKLRKAIGKEKEEQNRYFGTNENKVLEEDEEQVMGQQNERETEQKGKSRQEERRTLYRKEKSLKKRMERFGESSESFERPLRKHTAISRNKKTLYHLSKEQFSRQADIKNVESAVPTPTPSRRAIQINLPVVKNDELKSASFVSSAQIKLHEIRVGAEAVPKLVKSTSKINARPSTGDLGPSSSQLPNISATPSKVLCVEVAEPGEEAVVEIETAVEAGDTLTEKASMEAVNVKTFELELTRAFRFSYFPWLARRH